MLRSRTETRLMTQKLAITFLAGAVALTSCHKAAEKAGAGVTIVTVSEVAHLLQEKSAIVFDANGAETRQKYGVVPGAVLLSNNKTYSLSELPSEKSMK